MEKQPNGWKARAERLEAAVDSMTTNLSPARREDI
jgi:hypothetical protein